MNEIINWNKLKDRGDKRIEFEHFCYHLVSTMYGSVGTVSYYYNTPGSEFYLELNAQSDIEGIRYSPGDIIGWQSKFWEGAKDETNSPLDKDHKKELIDGFEKTKKYKPNIKLWIVCTPGSFVQTDWDKLVAELKKTDINCRFASWHKDVYEDFYLKNHEAYNGIFKYYFGEKFIDKSVLVELSKDTLSTLQAKYDVELHTPSDFENKIVGLLHTEDAVTLIVKAISDLKQNADEVSKKPILNENHWGYKYLTKRFKEDYTTDCMMRYQFIEDLYSLHIDKSNLNKVAIEIEQIIKEYQQLRQSRVDAINAELKLIYSRNKDENSNIDHYLQELIYRVRSLECKLTKDIEYSKVSLSSTIYLINQKVIPVFAEAGYGKTHLACSLANSMIRKELPVLFLVGGMFRHCDNCLSLIRGKLELPDSMSPDDVFACLDFLAERYNCKLPIIIDGLNETAPKESLWKYELQPLCRQINKRNNLLLITTCRVKSDYVKTIYEVNDYSEIENNILLNGINRDSVEVTVKKYFAKYNIKNARLSNISAFKNPLLLKIFCLANQGKENIEVNEYSLVSCLDDYSKLLIENICMDDGHSYKVAQNRFEKQMYEIADKIWQKNDRYLNFFDEFAILFNDKIVDKIVDEGLCLALDKNNGADQIQFTYDMVAGYYIAKSFIEKCDTINELNAFIEGISCDLFGETKHTLSEDIIKNLFYLIPKKFEKQWFDISDSEFVIKATLDNFCILLSSMESKKRLTTFLQKETLYGELAEFVFDVLIKRVHDRNIESIALFAPFFIRTSRVDLDRYWNCRFVTYIDLESAFNTIHDKFVAQSFCLEDRFIFAIMMCGITDIEYRQKFYWYLCKLVLSDSSSCLPLCINMLMIKDYFIKEIAISLLTCLGLRTKDKDIFTKCVSALECMISNTNTTNVALFDDLETLYSYGEEHYDDKFDRMLLYKNSKVEWPLNENITLDRYYLYDYDFDKYYIRNLFESDYQHTPDYKEDEIYGMLGKRILTYGYDELMYRELDKKEYDDAQYRHNLKSGYSYKYVRDALMELYGWLLLNGKLENEFKGTFRTNLISIDPSSPKLPLKRTLVTKFLLPKSNNDLSKWLQQSAMTEIIGLTECNLPKREGKWVLLKGFFKQKVDDRFAHLFMSCSSQLVPIKSKNVELDKSFLFEEVEFNHAFASELGWRDLEFAEEDYNINSELRLIYKYCFSNWSKKRFEYKNFYMLSTKIAKKLNLRFNMDKMSYYQGNEEVSAYYVNDTDFFFFLRKDLVDRILSIYDVKIIHRFYERRMIDINVPKSLIQGKDIFKEFEKDVIYEC